MACKAERLEKMRCVQRATGMQRLAAVVMACVRVAGVCHGLVCVCVLPLLLTSVLLFFFPLLLVQFFHLTQEKEEGAALKRTST